MVIGGNEREVQSIQKLLMGIGDVGPMKLKSGKKVCGSYLREQPFTFKGFLVIDNFFCAV